MTQFNLKVLTPEKEIYNDLVDEIVISTSTGEIAVLAHHTNLLTKIIPGELRIKKNNKEQVMVVGVGMLQMSNNSLSILTDLAQHPEEIDLKVVEEAKKRAEQALEQKLGDEEYATAYVSLQKSLAQIKVKHRHLS